MIREMGWAENAPSLNIERNLRKTATGKIRIAAHSKSGMAVRLVLLALTALTVLGFLTFNYKNINFGGAIVSTLTNAKTLFVLPRLAHDTAMGLLYQLFVTFCIGILSTLFGAVIAFLCALLCARNIPNPKVAALVKGIMAFIRAVPTILWVSFRCSATWADGFGAVRSVQTRLNPSLLLQRTVCRGARADFFALETAIFEQYRRQELEEAILKREYSVFTFAIRIILL